MQKEPGAPEKDLKAGVLTNSGLGSLTLHNTKASKTDDFEVWELICLKRWAFFFYFILTESYYYLWNLFPWRLVAA